MERRFDNQSYFWVEAPRWQNIRVDSDGREALPATRQYDGCKHVNLCLGLDDTTQVILTPEWESEEKHLAYIQFRTEDGSLDKIRALVTEQPKITYDVIQGA